MASAERFHGQSSPLGRQARRYLQNVVYKFHHRDDPLVWCEYLELVPYERIRYTDKFDDPNMPGEIQVTITLKKVSVGTELSIVQEGLPDVIPPEACYLGWQESLKNLAQLV